MCLLVCFINICLRWLSCSLCSVSHLCYSLHLAFFTRVLSLWIPYCLEYSFAWLILLVCSQNFEPLINLVLIEVTNIELPTKTWEWPWNLIYVISLVLSFQAQAQVIAEAMSENGMHFDSFLVNHEFDLFVKLNTLNNISELNTRFSLIFAISVSDL